MEIYLDVLFLENLVINYLILLVTAKLAKCRTSNLRMFLGALTGAAYAVLLILAPDMKVYYTPVAKVILSLFIVAIAFWPEKVTAFFKTLAAFYLSSFLFAGAAFAFLYFNRSGGFVRNGIVYVFWQSQGTLILFSVITVFIIIRIFWDIVQSRMLREKLLIPVKISFESRNTEIEALVDTGNSLHDPLTNLPVVVVEFKAIRDILPEEIKSIFDSSHEDDLLHATQMIAGTHWMSRFRLIPFTSLGKENGMLIGFKPDYIEIGENDERRGIHEVIIGIYNRALSKNEQYRALLSPDLM